MSISRHPHHQQRRGDSPPRDGRAPPPPPPPLGLARFGSAPGSFAADSGIGFGAAAGAGGRMFLGEPPSAASESTCKSAASAAGTTTTTTTDFERCRVVGKPSQQQQQRAGYCVGEASVAGARPDDSRGGGNSLLRHSSSPAGFFSSHSGGFQVPRDFGSCSRPGMEGMNHVESRRLKSQLSFSGRGLPDIGDSVGCSNNNSDVTSGGGSQSYMSSNFSTVGPWGDTNSIIFSAPPTKRTKDINGDIITLSTIDSQFCFPNTTLEMATMDKYMQLQHDQTPFKVRAKRGCATHPRSIAERERRTRISEKLKKLQELVPNMDKQTNTADMLDLAVKHIRGLQNQVQVLQKEQENCKCKKK